MSAELSTMPCPTEGGSWNSYAKIYNVGHRALAGFFDTPVTVEEKVDGSQFSFGIFGGQIRVRSKGVVMDPDSPEKMFNEAVATVHNIAGKLTDGFTYRAEYLKSPSHNTLKYNRIPNHHLVIFDVATGMENYMGPHGKALEAERIGLEVVPVLYDGMMTLEKFTELLENESFLGGCNVEGLVCKRHDVFGVDGKVLIAKHVSEAFKEVHGKEWKAKNPTTGDVFADLADRYCVEARWVKAAQRLRDEGRLLGEPKDIPEIVKEIQRDVKDECHGEIVDALMRIAMPRINRGCVRGVPEWYKQQLLESSFEVKE